MAALWAITWEDVAADFTGATDAAALVQLGVRLGVAAVLAGLLGWQRERSGKAAGLRTHMLVAMGAATFVLLPQQAGWSNTELARIVQGTVAGIGFLGAGTIVKHGSEQSIRGLTTAADIWLTAGIGIAAGLGHLAGAVVVTTVTFLVLSVVVYFEPKPGQEGHDR